MSLGPLSDVKDLGEGFIYKGEVDVDFILHQKHVIECFIFESK